MVQGMTMNGSEIHSQSLDIAWSDVQANGAEINAQRSNAEQMAMFNQEEGN